MKYLRTATEQDMDLLFEWANEASVRANSFKSGRITYEEHMKWYQTLLSQNDAKQYIFMCDNEAIGQIRVTVKEETAEVGYSICNQKRHMGYGKEMIRLLAEQVRKDFPQVQRLVAKVKPENTASSKIFLNLGYVEKYRFYELEMDISENVK